MFRILNSRGRACLLKQLCQCSSLTPAVANNALSDKDLPSDKDIHEDINKKKTVPRKLVSAAFQKLKEHGQPIEVQDSISKMITDAKNLDQLLTIVSVKKLTKNHALKVRLESSI